MESLATSPIEWGVATLAMPGSSECGDRHVVKPLPNAVLVAVMDGIGHGQEAAVAAQLATNILEAHPDEPVIKLVGRCHENLRGTRGVVMSLASFHIRDGLMTWLGVGNVQGVLLRASTTMSLREESLMLRAGVVGGQLPPLQAAVLPVAPGDTLLFATDGIRSGFPRGMAQNQPPQRAAQSILAQHANGSDDALVLIARYVGNRT
jgi:phosphoserine phosphatase RsbX